MAPLVSRQYRVRHVLLVAVGLWFVYRFVLGPLQYGYDAVPESQLLEHLMNRVNETKGPPALASGFDWSSVRFHYDPGHLEPLPSEGAPLPLPPIQHRSFTEKAESSSARRTREARREAVRQLFRKNWASYRKYAWKKDALMPISAKGKDQFCGWAATLVDSLDTLWIMGLREEFDEAVAAAATIDFGKTNTGGGSDSVNMFETNIRYLGGLLAAYDLSGRPALLKKATELGDLLYAGFNTENRMPVDFIDFERAKTGEGLTVEPSVVSASPGTLSLELTRLSQVTGDPKYYDAATRVMRHFAKAQNATLLPGMWPMYVYMSSNPPNMETGSHFTLAGGADSLYEYLPKMHALLGGRDHELVDYEAMSLSFLDTADRHLLYRPMLPSAPSGWFFHSPPDVLIAGSADVVGDGEKRSVHLDTESEHLTCFAGGTFALAGRLFARPDLVTTGARLARGCAVIYASTPSGLGPERFRLLPCGGGPAKKGSSKQQPCRFDNAQWDYARRQAQLDFRKDLPRGFVSARDPRYILRPEAIESLFYLWRITAEKEWVERAWDMFVAVARGTETPYANAAVLDVLKDPRQEGGLPQEDYMEVSSFDSLWSLDMCRC